MSRPSPKTRRSEPNPFLSALGERVRTLRAMRGMSRKALAKDAQISERFLADLESGAGNASILLLKQVADALALPLTELLGNSVPSNNEWTLITQMLAKLPEAQVRSLLQNRFAADDETAPRFARIALVGLRGAGKSTLAPMLAQALRRPFVELNHEIEALTGMRTDEVHIMLGQAAYRRYEKRSLENAIHKYPRSVIATPGSLVSEAATYSLLLSRCFTVWVKARPEEHMERVIAQGDMRPMAGNREAMDDLRRILAGRTPLYAKADYTLDTSDKTVDESFGELLEALAERGVADIAARATAFAD